MNIIEKPWGREEILETNEKYTVKRLTMFKGHKCSLQLHRYKMESIYVLKGPLYIHIKNKIRVFNENEFITIEPNIIHRMEAIENDCVYLESSTSELDDVIRIEDDYERK